MHAEILFSEEVENLAGRVSDAVVDLLADLSSELTDAALRTAVNELIITAREHLARQPVDPAPMVRAILRKDLIGRRLSPDGVVGFGIAVAPAVPSDRGRPSVGILVVVEPPIGGKALVMVHPQVVDDVSAVGSVAVVGPPLMAPARATGFSAPSYWPAVPAISDHSP